MEFGTIEREIYVEASPEVVFEVVSSPDHLTAVVARRGPLRPGARIDRARSSSASRGDDGRAVVQLTVVEARPPRTFSFRWTQPAGEPAAAGNSLLVTFDLTPSGGGTLLKMTETGFREMGWEVAVLEQQYHEHVTGWDFYLPRLVAVRRRRWRCGRDRRRRWSGSTTTCGRRSATRPGGGCSTCCSPTATARRRR